jgi:hypothetical protein
MHMRKQKKIAATSAEALTTSLSNMDFRLLTKR